MGNAPYPMNNKTCTKCQKSLNLEEFSKDRQRKDGYRPSCRSCDSERAKVYRTLHPEVIKNGHIKYFSENKEKIYKRKNAWRKEKYKKDEDYRRSQVEFQRAYRANPITNQKKLLGTRRWERRQRANNPMFKVVQNLRRRLNFVLHGQRKAEHSMSLIGCNREFLRSHLESRFQPGMTWDNYGARGWHIDHITPCASFDLSIPEQQRKCFHYSNLQPLWAKDNLEKGNKIKTD